MPLFEYVCLECGIEFEKIVPSYDSPVQCTHCGTSEIEKKLSVFAVAGERGNGSIEEGSCGTCGSDTPGMCGMN